MQQPDLQRNLELCRCENVKVRFQQRDIDREKWECVDPGHSVDYAWEEPNQPHRLCVSLESEGVAFRDASEHEYNLDVIKATPNPPSPLLPPPPQAILLQILLAGMADLPL